MPLRLGVRLVETEPTSQEQQQAEVTHDTSSQNTGETTQEQQQAEVTHGTSAPSQDTSSSSSSVQPSVTVNVSREEFEKLLADSASTAASAAAAEVGTKVSDTISSGGTVALVDEQYNALRTMDGAQLHGVVFAIGLLSLILGAIVAVGMTLHMRGARNG